MADVRSGTTAHHIAAREHNLAVRNTVDKRGDSDSMVNWPAIGAGAGVVAAGVAAYSLFWWCVPALHNLLL